MECRMKSVLLSDFCPENKVASNLSKEDASRWFDFVKYSRDGKILKKDIGGIISLLIDADAIPKNIHPLSVIAEGFARVI
jgi:hypothetical protein